MVIGGSAISYTSNSSALMVSSVASCALPGGRLWILVCNVRMALTFCIDRRLETFHINICIPECPHKLRIVFHATATGEVLGDIFDSSWADGEP